MEDKISKVVALLKKKAKSVDVGSAYLQGESQKFLRSGILVIDWVLGNKGIALGKLVEIYGDYSSGKSWFSYRMLGRAQDEGMVAILLDTEGSFSPEWARKCGCNVESLVVYKPFTIEEVFESLFSVMRELRDERLFIVWDSLAMTPSEKEIEDGFDKRDLTKAAVIGQGLRMTLRLMEDRDVTLMVVNQLREKIGQTFGEVEFTPGGRALGYAVSERLRFFRKSKIKHEDNIVGCRIKVECTKSKFFEPFRWVECEFMFGRGIEKWSGVFELLERLGYIVGSGGWYRFEGEDRKWRKDDFWEMVYMKDERVMNLIKSVFQVSDEELERG